MVVGHQGSAVTAFWLRIRGPAQARIVLRQRRLLLFERRGEVPLGISIVISTITGI